MTAAIRGPANPPIANLTAPPWEDARNQYLALVVRGHTFADVGGLWRVVQERCSVAHAAGAQSVALLDVTPLDDPMWMQVRERHARLKVPCEYVSTDLHVSSRTFEVVHCSGVLYHCPDPAVTLGALRRLATQHLILTSCILPEVVTNAVGSFEAAPWTCIPEMAPDDAAVLRAHWVPMVGADAIGITRDWPTKIDPNNWEPWYWLPTIAGFIASAEAAGFRLLDHAPIWHGHAHTLLLEPAS